MINDMRVVQGKLEVLKILRKFRFWAYPMYFRNTNGRGMGERWEQDLSKSLAFDGFSA